MRKILMLALIFMFVRAAYGQAQPTLTLGQLATVTITADAPAPSVFFDATAGQRLNIQLVSITSGVFPTFTIYTADEEILQYTGNPARTNTLDAATVIPVDGTYRLEVWNVDSLPGQIVLLVEDAGTSGGGVIAPTPPAQNPPTDSPAPNATPGEAQRTACTISPQGAQPVNVREGPLNLFRAIGALQPGQSLPVVGRDRESAWYQVQMDAGLGWVAASVTLVDGDCASVPEVFVPIPTRTPTPTPTFTPTPVPTHTPTFTPTPTVSQGGGVNPPIKLQTQVFSNG